MELALIAALSENRVIGKDGQIPWKIPKDLRRFRKLTVGNAVIMGRKTHESIGKPLDKRFNIVLTRNADLLLPDVTLCSSLDAALMLCNSFDTAYVIGGESVYKEALPLADRLELTYVDGIFDGDAFFPGFNLDDWIETERLPRDAYSFVTYMRKK